MSMGYYPADVPWAQLKQLPAFNGHPRVGPLLMTDFIIENFVAIKCDILDLDWFITISCYNQPSGLKTLQYKLIDDVVS